MAHGTPPRALRLKARTLFLSDIHLGFRHARARELNEFLAGVEAESIVLVGDIIDALSLARRAYWSADHTQVLRTLLARQRAGTRLVYIPGNHDASLAMLAQMLQGQFEVHREWVHRSASGARTLVLHGDQFDGLSECPRWLHSPGRFHARAHGAGQPRRQQRAPRARQALLAAHRGAQARHRHQRALHRALRAGGRRPCARARLRRGHLRAHPPRQPARHRRHHLRQHRGLGGVVLGADRVRAR